MEDKYRHRQSVDMQEDVLYDVIVVGMGPAGASAALYAFRKGLKVAIIGEKIGGQLLSTNEIRNIIGITQTSGQEYSLSIENHLAQYAIAIKEGTFVKEISLDNKDKIVTDSDGKKYRAKSLILATGTKHRRLRIKGEDKFLGKGVHFCTTCDGPFYAGLNVAIVGGGNSGVEALLDMANVAKQVYLIEVMPELKADKILQEKMEKETEAKIYTNTEIKEIKGSDFVEEIVCTDKTTNEDKVIKVDGIFFEIGSVANTDFVKNVVALNERGEIVIDKNNMTSVEGIFAAGDCTDIKFKQIVVAVGEGCKATLSAFEYLMTTY